jgi:hypothetical protein
MGKVVFVLKVEVFGVLNLYLIFIWDSATRPKKNHYKKWRRIVTKQNQQYWAIKLYFSSINCSYLFLARKQIIEKIVTFAIHLPTIFNKTKLMTNIKKK